MSLSRAIPAIVTNDVRRLLRDQFLLGVSAYIIGISVVLRWLVPWLQAELLARQGFDLEPYLALATSYFILVNSGVLTGMVGGFLLLESREEQAVRALLVCPTPLWVHLGTLGGGIMLTGTVLAVVESLIIGVGVPELPAIIAASALVAPSGFVMALILATVASNKVEAFAVMKIVSILGLVPIPAFFLPEPWQFLAGVAPAYWGCKLWWMAAEGTPGGAWLVGPGVVVSAVWIGLLLHRFRSIAAR